MIFDKFINKRNLSRYNSIADDVDKMYEKETKNLTINDLKNALFELKENQKLDKRKKIVRALAISKSAAFQVLGMKYYRVQLLGGMALIDGNMAEMKTGEGKTLTCSIATITNYALGFKTHVITANEYLSTRDEATLKPLYDALGISSATNVANQSQSDKKTAYACDILYSTASELGFDYLRDNLVHKIEDKVQPLNFQEVKIIIDEADFVLIDEATTPLIISGHKPLKDLEIYHVIKNMIEDFKPVSLDPNASRMVIDNFIPDGDFWLDKKSKRTFFSDSGYERLEKLVVEHGLLDPNVDNLDLYSEVNSWLINEICQALNAKWIYQKDKDYVVMNDEITIVDLNTGRLSIGRSWSNGLHQAIQAKEGITIQAENTTSGTITVQNYLKLYHQISGMSGTIMQSTEEFEQIYSCSTISIPPNKPSQRLDMTDCIYFTEQAKYKAMVEEITRIHLTGQPILIGTVSVAESEIVSNYLTQAGLPHQVINAKNHELEAKIIAQAGQKSKITVATSMAGRGTDIILGGNKEAMSQAILEDFQHLSERVEFAKFIIEEHHGELTIDLNSEEFSKNVNLDYTLNTFDLKKYYDSEYLDSMAKTNPQQLLQDLYQIHFNLNTQLVTIQNEWEKMKEEIISLGGLCVVGSSRNVSRRIDNQLIGRSGRQGDPGRSIFFLSLDDEWLKVFGNQSSMQRIMQNVDPNAKLEGSLILKLFTVAQNSAEGNNFEFRKSTFQYDTSSDEGRKAFFDIRDKLLINKIDTLENLLIHELVISLSYITNPAFESFLEEEFKLDIPNGLSFALTKTIPELLILVEKFKNSNDFSMYIAREDNIKDPEFIQFINDFVMKDRENNLDKSYAMNLIAAHSTYVLDELWADHLSYIDTAKKSVGYASIVQKNPLHEYKKLCFESFSYLFNTFSSKMLDMYINSYINRESIMEEMLNRQNENDSLNSNQLQNELNRIDEEGRELTLLPPRVKHQFLPSELIEQPQPIRLYNTVFSMQENGRISPFNTLKNENDNNSWNNFYKTISNNQKDTLVSIFNLDSQFAIQNENENIITDKNMETELSEPFIEITDGISIAKVLDVGDEIPLQSIQEILNVHVESENQTSDNDHQKQSVKISSANREDDNDITDVNIKESHEAVEIVR